MLRTGMMRRETDRRRKADHTCDGPGQDSGNAARLSAIRAGGRVLFERKVENDRTRHLPGDGVRRPDTREAAGIILGGVQHVTVVE
jgi:hypothetical protein